MMKKSLAILLTMILMVSVLSGCSSKKGETTGGTPVTDIVTEDKSVDKVDVKLDGYKEAPMLAELVTSGALPSVEERVPTKNGIMIENAPVGKYGGVFEFSYMKAGWDTGKPIEEGLFRFKADGSLEPNVAKGYDVNEDATVYTIYLREGMKWSDGVDFTAEDVVFFYNHMCIPETFGKSLWDAFKVTDPATGEETIATIEKADDYTVTVTFQSPKASFIEGVAINGKWLYAPAHYHKTILPEFIGEEAAEAKAKEMGYSDVVAMGKDTGYYFWNVPGIPTLNPYILSEEKGKSDVNGDYYEFVRNPYYWKVDTEGNQLPYIDKMEISRIADASQTLLKLLAGEITVAAGLPWEDISTLEENSGSSGYKLLQWYNSGWADIASQLQLNQTVSDDALRGLFQSKEFREALSIAVDREEYSLLISDGWSDPKQASPSAGMQGYTKEWEEKWTEYDPVKAKGLLEGLGLVMGSDGYYKFADGKELVLNMTSFTGSGSDDTYVVLNKYLGEVGIKTTYQPVDKDLLNNRLTSNEFEVVLGPVSPAETVNIKLRPDTLVPVRNYAAWYGQIGNWYASGGTEGVEPTGDLLELCNLYTELRNTIDEEKQDEIAGKMLKLHEENVWVIGYMGTPTTLIAVDSKLKNFPEQSVFSDEFRGLGIAHLQNCYFEE